MTPRFTLNLGLRWEYMQPIYEVADRQVNINTFTGQLIHPGGDFGRALYNGYPHQYMPRIGFAYSITNKLVLRAGYAYQSFMEGTGANLRTTLNPPFFVETNFQYDPRTPGSITTGFSDVATSNVTLDMPRPPGVTVPQLQGRAWDLNLRPQTTQQLNATLEYQFGQTTSVSVGYVGQKGTHLVAPVEANQPVAGIGPFSTWTRHQHAASAVQLPAERGEHRANRIEFDDGLPLGTGHRAPPVLGWRGVPCLLHVRQDSDGQPGILRLNEHVRRRRLLAERL